MALQMKLIHLVMGFVFASGLLAGAQTGKPPDDSPAKGSIPTASGQGSNQVAPAVPAIPNFRDPIFFDYQEGIAAARGGDYEKALNTLVKVQQRDPKYLFVWRQLGRVYLVQKQYDAAVDAFRHQMEITPEDVETQRDLGLALAWKQDYSLAVKALERSVENDGTAESRVALADAYCHLGRASDCDATLVNAVKVNEDAANLNNVAWAMANRDFKLDDALAYSQKAVALGEAKTGDISVNNVGWVTINRVSSLARYWDTLGWVHYHRGEIGAAENYLRSTWSVRKDRIIADHLAQIYQKQNDVAQAKQYFLFALASPGASYGVKERFTALAGLNAATDQAIMAAKKQIEEQRTVNTPLVSEKPGEAFVNLTISGDGILEARFSGGDPALSTELPSLVGVKTPISFPDKAATKIVYFGKLMCPGKSNCTLQLSNSDQRPVQAYPPELLTDSRGVDFGPYILLNSSKLKQTWLQSIPPEARPPTQLRGEVGVEVTLNKDGHITDLQIQESSGNTSLDRAAFEAVLNTSPYAAFPSSFTGPVCRLRFRFNYNPR